MWKTLCDLSYRFLLSIVQVLIISLLLIKCFTGQTHFLNFLFVYFIAEVGRILPAEFGIYRTSEVYNPLKGIRKNLPFFTDLKNEVPTVTA